MKFWISIYHPIAYDGSKEDEQMGRDIDELNDDMEAAGARLFAGGLRPVGYAKSLHADSSGKVVVSDGPYLQTNEHVGGFWLLECATMEEALEWGRKATIACRVPVQVRPFY